jgi:hypothetical protein
MHCLSVPGSWIAETLKLVVWLGLEDDVVILQQRHAATLEIADDELRQQRQSVCAGEWETYVRAALQRRDKEAWLHAMQSDGRMGTLASLYAEAPLSLDADLASALLPRTVGLAAKQIWRLESYLLNGDEYARHQQALLRYGGQQLRLTRGRWERPRLKREQRLCQLCDMQAVEDERHMVTACPFFSDERDRLRYLLAQLNEPVPGPSGRAGPALNLTVTDDDAVFGAVLGILPSSCPPKPSRVALMYCRQFLTTALRRRERQLASLKKRRSGGSELVPRDLPADAAGQADAAAEAERIVDIADAATDSDHEHPDADIDAAAGIRSHCGDAAAGDGSAICNVMQLIVQ